MAKVISRTSLVAGTVGIVVGLALALAAEQIDRYTSTDEFCGASCHSMNAYVANEEIYLQSAHRNSPTGVIAGCADCHMPKGLVPATWEHVRSGIKDIVAELSHDFEDPDVWEDKRAGLAYAVRDKMLASDSANCRYCHQMNKIAVVSETGQRAHARAESERRTCIQCHYNLVHSPVPPRPDFASR